jgi:hypothetical protein
MIKLYRENIVTDLKKYGITLSPEMFDTINEYIDIQNSEVHKIDIDSYRDLKDKYVMIADGSDIIAAYGNNKFMYNPRKIKISDAPSYDVYEVSVGGVNVQNRRQQRRDALKGLVKPSETEYQNVPHGTSYIYDKDWNPETNKVYYSKLLQQNNLGKYATQLNDAYDIVKELIDQRRERLTGKRSEYDRLITDISKQINKIEDEMVSVERDFNADVDKLKKELSKLPNLIKRAKFFIKTENDEYRKFGKRKPLPYAKIEK